MAELLIALAPLVALAGLALLVLLVPLEIVAGLALSLIAVGVLVGVPTGLYYHVLLRRALLSRGRLPKGWYWKPQQHEATLERSSVQRLRPWFYVGGFGFLLVVTGFTLAVSALLVWLRTQGPVLP